MSNIKSLPSELQKIAETELNENPARIPEYLQTLKAWIEEQPHLNARLDDQFLIQFLRGCKYNLKKAEHKIDLFFTLKSKFPDFFNVTDVNDVKFRKLFNYGYGQPLPIPLNDNGARIFFMPLVREVAEGLIDIEELYTVINTMQEVILMDDPYACINGIIYVVDLKDITLNFASQFTPNFLKKCVDFYENSLPFRMRAIHFINMPDLFQKVINILKPMLSDKLRKRVFVHGEDYANPENGIPIKYLPSYLGGENGSTEKHLKTFEKKWLEYENYFKENANYGTDELLRPGKPIDFDGIYGMGGSFRKLNVD